MLKIHNYIFFVYLSDPSIAIDKVNKCISDIRTWMIQNKLKINVSKTRVSSFNFLIFKAAL